MSADLQALSFVSMPLIEVTFAPDVGGEQLVRLLQALPHAVSVAVECPEEPYEGELQAGDLEIRSRVLGPYDVSGLDFVVEVRSKWFASRAQDRQVRCDRLRDMLVEAVGSRSIGVYLSLPVAAWSQVE